MSQRVKCSKVMAVSKEVILLKLIFFLKLLVSKKVHIVINIFIDEWGTIAKWISRLLTVPWDLGSKPGGGKN